MSLPLKKRYRRLLVFVVVVGGVVHPLPAHDAHVHAQFCVSPVQVHLHFLPLQEPCSWAWFLFESWLWNVS